MSNMFLESGFLGIEFYDNDFLKLIFRFFINISAILIIARAI